MNMELANFPYLSAILLSCVVGLLVILFIPREREALVKGVSLVFSGIALAVSIYVYCAYDRTLGGLQFVEKLLWVEPLGIHYFHGAAGTGQGVLCFYLRARARRLRLLHEHGSLLPLCLVRRFALPHVSAHRHL